MKNKLLHVEEKPVFSARNEWSRCVQEMDLMEDHPLSLVGNMKMVSSPVEQLWKSYTIGTCRVHTKGN